MPFFPASHLLVLPLLLNPFMRGALALASCQNVALPLPAKTIFQFAPGKTGNFTFFENVVSRQNGDILITMVIPESNVFILQNPMSQCPTLSPVFSVPGTNGTDGIVEIANRPDVFAVIAGNLTLSGDPANGVPNSWSVWEIDLSCGTSASTPPSGSNSSTSCNPNPAPPAVTARKISDFPMAPRLNGLAAIPGTSAILVGDSELGVAFRLDTATGEITTALNFTEMKPVPGAGSVDDALGLNGMKIANGSLYFTNAAARTINRVAILPDGSGPAAGATVERIASVPTASWMDDLDIRKDGSLWVSTNSNSNWLLAIQPNGTVTNATGTRGQSQFMDPVVAVGSANSTAVAGDSAVIFGRGSVSNNMLFVVTGSGDEPAKVVAVDTSSCK